MIFDPNYPYIYPHYVDRRKGHNTLSLMINMSNDERFFGLYGMLENVEMVAGTGFEPVTFGL